MLRPFILSITRVYPFSSPSLPHTGSRIRLVTLDIAISLIKSLVIRASDGSSGLEDHHFAEIEGIREESTLLLRNFYKVRRRRRISFFPDPVPSAIHYSFAAEAESEGLTMIATDVLIYSSFKLLLFGFYPLI